MAKTKSARTTTSRKKEHVDLSLKEDVGFLQKKTGLEQFDFVNNALPELNLSDVDCSAMFLGKILRAPFMVSCMTGGYADAMRINRQLAEVCCETGIAMGVGSQRQALENSRYHESFGVVREVAANIPVVGNIGGAEVGQMRNADDAKRLVELIRADAFTVHLNPLQEFLQPEGNTNFRNVLNGIEMLVTSLPIPVIVKEIGAGISAEVARKLLDVGVRYIDVAGAGGTSWAGIEALRRRDKSPARSFWDWGIPTARAIQQVSRLKMQPTDFVLIGSGGIESGIEAAKCIALGADIVASARPMLSALHKSGKKGLANQVSSWIFELRGAMFLTGSKTIADLQRAPLVTSGIA